MLTPDPLDAAAPVATIDLDAIAANAARLRTRLHGGADLLAAVKADAYGHGLLPVARTLAAAGVGWFGVATPHEVRTLRDGGVAGRILVFGPLPAPALPPLLPRGVDLSVATTDDVAAVADAAAPLRAAGELREDVPLHVAIDTGMGRIGPPPDGVAAVARAAADLEGVRLEGVWTHFARADEADPAPTDAQHAAYLAALDALAADGLTPTLAHAANSAATLAHPATHHDLVRPGIALYGHAPAPDLADAAADLTPALTLDAPVTFVKDVPAGTAVSYGHAWTAPRATRIATVRLGYADGYPRAASNLGDAHLPGGGAARVVGRVCMDQLMLDVGDADLEPGDRVTLLAGAGPAGAATLAARLGTIPYELLARVGPRVVRRYRGGGSPSSGDAPG